MLFRLYVWKYMYVCTVWTILFLCVCMYLFYCMHMYAHVCMMQFTHEKWKGGMYGGHYTAFAKCESIVLGNSPGSDGEGAYGSGPDAGEVRSSSSWDTDSSKVSLAGQLTLLNKVGDLHLYTCMHTYIHTYIHTCNHTFLHTYIHTYIYTFLHT